MSDKVNPASALFAIYLLVVGIVAGFGIALMPYNAPAWMWAFLLALVCIAFILGLYVLSRGDGQL
jgi:amino acid transporter